VAEKKTETPCCAGGTEETCCEAENEAEAPCCEETTKTVVPGRCC
jgi:hypothetical protein